MHSMLSRKHEITWCFEKRETKEHTQEEEADTKLMPDAIEPDLITER